MEQNAPTRKATGRRDAIAPDGRRRRALITGASAGIGAALAQRFADRGFDLTLTARRRDKLDAVAATIAARTGRDIAIIPQDLAEPEASERLFAATEGAGVAIDALICNAGYGIRGRYVETEWRRLRDQLQVLVTGLAELNHRFLPAMEERRYGRILNVASLAGFFPGSPTGTLYTPAKSFVIKLSEGLHLEYEDANVHVCALCPGLTRSEFHAVLGAEEMVNSVPRFLWMDADEVAVQGFDAVMAGRPVAVTGGANRALAFLSRHAPSGLLYAGLRRNGDWGRRLSLSAKGNP